MSPAGMGIAAHARGVGYLCKAEEKRRVVCGHGLAETALRCFDIPGVRREPTTRCVPVEIDAVSLVQACLAHAKTPVVGEVDDHRWEGCTVRRRNVLCHRMRALSSSVMQVREKENASLACVLGLAEIRGTGTCPRTCNMRLATCAN